MEKKCRTSDDPDCTRLFHDDCTSTTVAYLGQMLCQHGEKFFLRYLHYYCCYYYRYYYCYYYYYYYYTVVIIIVIIIIVITITITVDITAPKSMQKFEYS